MNIPSIKQRGFTIIEVVLVLAIVALILLMIFVALPALQAGQRDQARKQDAGMVSTAVTNFTSAHRRLPTTTGPNASGDLVKLRNYIDALDQYDKNNVRIKTDTADPAADEIAVYLGKKCNGPDLQDGNRREAAVRIQLDRPGTYYCVSAS